MSEARDIIRDARVKLFDLGDLELRRVSDTKGAMFPTAPDFEERATLYNDIADLHAKGMRGFMPIEFAARMEDLCGEGWDD